jgi:GTPase SAR1 family protein
MFGIFEMFFFGPSSCLLSLPGTCDFFFWYMWERALLITGKPGCGKTTLAKSIATRLQAQYGPEAVSGFVTTEIRDEAGTRIGFDLGEPLRYFACA